MLKLTEDAQAYLAEVQEQARIMGPDAEESLRENLAYLATYACPEDGSDPERTLCYLGRDFAPLSFAFGIAVRRKNGEHDFWFNGGLIYSGPGVPANGSAPSFTVSLDPDCSNGRKHRWSIHT